MKLRPNVVLRLLGAGAVLILAPLACGQATPDGHWEGSVNMENRQIAMSLDLAKNAKAEWVASMGVPAAKVSGLVVMNVAVEGKSVKFLAVELMMTKFELTLGADGKMTGTAETPQGRAPAEFKRTGEAKVELMPPSPAVSKELEGDWEGSLELPGRAFPVVFHFRNQPDKTVLATIDTPVTRGIGVPLNDVRQTGKKVEFGVRVAHAGYQGTLNAEGTELTGQWTHEEQSLPLTLRKK